MDSLDEIVKKAEKVLSNSPKHLCPITLQLFSEGWNFERNAIETWFQEHDTNPQTNRVVPAHNRVDLKTNFSKKSDVDEYKRKVLKKCLHYYPLVTKFTELQKKLIIRAYEMNPRHEFVLEKKREFEEESKKRGTTVKLLEVLIQEGNFTKAKEIILGLENHLVDETLLRFLITVDAKNVVSCDRYRFHLAKVLHTEKRPKEALIVLREMVKETEEGLDLVLVLHTEMSAEIDEKSVEHLTVMKFRKNDYEGCMRVISALGKEQLRVRHFEKLKYNLVKIQASEAAAGVCVKICDNTGALEEKMRVMEEAMQLHKSVGVLEKYLQITQHLNNKLRKVVSVHRQKELERQIEVRTLQHEKAEFEKERKSLRSRIFDLERKLKLASEKKRKANIFRRRKKSALSNSNANSNKQDSILPLKAMSRSTSTPNSTKLSSSMSKSQVIEIVVERKNSKRMEYPTNAAIHKGYICDGCHCSPIVGPRFSAVDPGSKKPLDFDVCEQCHASDNAQIKNKTFIEIKKAL